jgi:ABC-type lipoprotein export system ATPase subunit
LHGSDAHKLDDIGRPAEDRHCWIKADLTFEGLKQVLFEPRERVVIAEEPPILKNDYQVIQSIEVTDAPDWFTPQEIILNQDLVAVIGPRGSGKSALAEMIAFAGGATFFRSSEDVRDTFLFKASKRSAANPTPITGATVNLKWRDGQMDRVQVPSTLQHGREEEKVKYLPQRFVERLCAPENNRQLEEEIERVIFQRIDKTERMDASNFGELRQTATKALGVKRSKLERTIQGLNQAIADASARTALRPTKENELKRKRDELHALLKNEPQVPQANREELERLATLTKLKEQLEAKIVDCNEQLNTLDTIATKFDVLKDDVGSFNRDIQALLERVGLAKENATFLVHVPSEVTGVLVRRRSELERAVAELRKGVADKAEITSLDKVSSEIEAIRAASRLTETKKKEQEKFQRDRKQLEDSITSIEREIKEITEVVGPKQKEESETRTERYLDLFELLKEERAILGRLYEPLRASLLSSNETARKLEFVSKPTFDVLRHAVRGMELLDRRKALYGESQELERALKAFFDEAVDADFDRTKTREALHRLHESFIVHGNTKLPIGEQLRKERTTKEFADWFYGIEDFSVTYSIKFDGKDLHLLSPGEKGVVLLLLYLEAENQDNRPLIIDQPDDNLDNVSVYPSLTEYFRTRKRTRQIIIITHNPNLVVNTDAEQVFVADFDGARNPKIVYRSGSLEDSDPEGSVPGIREEVCEILEGGTVAFQLREQRYALP